jgi:glycosyltransferase involved in cell wall biosynthesis
MVSVVMITYKHQAVIATAIQGVLMQQTNFDVELIIADDCSPDDTSTLVENISKEDVRGDWIKYFKHNNNIGVQANFVFAVSQAKGKYIALCEGDDFWTDPRKLQKQVDFLEKNIGVVACGHETLVKNYKWTEYSEATLSEWFKIPLKFDYSQEEFIIAKYPFHTSSVMFRNIIDFKDSDIRHIFTLSKSGDNILYTILGNLGKAHFINEIMSVYRLTNDGISNNFSGQTLINNLKGHILAYRQINLFFKEKNQTAVNSLILKTFDNIVFNRKLYNSRTSFYKDLACFLFSDNFGKLGLYNKFKIVLKNILF